MSADQRKNDRHKQKTVSFRLPEGLMAQFRLLATRNRRTLSAEAQLALEARLAAEGLWPPAADGRDGVDGRAGMDGQASHPRRRRS
ncbi:MAG: hypothetical protein JNM56_30195 [Planctomycetia bacterium]|nr:hypothetical protein [Planctomycetia bacterium]